MSECVRASRLYDVESRSLEGREIRADGGHSSNGTERTVSDEEPAAIEPSYGWASEAVDDRHSMGGAGAGCREVLRTPHLYNGIRIRPLQTDTDRDGGER